MEWRNAEGRLDRVPEIVRELVSVNVDVIVMGTVPLVRSSIEQPYLGGGK